MNERTMILSNKNNYTTVLPMPKSMVARWMQWFMERFDAIVLFIFKSTNR